MNSYATTSHCPDGWSTQDILKNLRKAKAEFDAIQERTLQSAAKVAEIECPVCHRKVTTINRGDIVACEHIIEQLKAACAPPPRFSDPMPSDPFAIKIFPLDDGPSRF